MLMRFWFSFPFGLLLASLAFGNAGVWDIPVLQETPEAEWGKREGILQEVYYTSVPFRGKPTKVFAYVARPAKGAGPFPAMVLMHGGGGQAFSAWAEHWAGRGYVAIAMDLAGRGPGTDKKRHADAGPAMGNPTIMMAANSDGELRDGWTYHAVAAAMRAYSLLKTLPEVDANRIGITGISWGGYATSMVASLDKRFKVAVPVYGCGFLHENSYWTNDIINAMTQESRDLWVESCDPSSYLSGVSRPILFVNGANDPRFYLDITCRSALLVAPEYRNLAIKDGLKHGHYWNLVEVDRFVDAALKDRDVPPRFETPVVNGREVSVKFANAPTGSFKAYLYYAASNVPWKDRQWTRVSARVSGNVLFATLPGKHPAAFYFSIVESDDLSASSLCWNTGGNPFQEVKIANMVYTTEADVVIPPVRRDLETMTNSIGMEFMRIPAGEFQMGQQRGNEWFTGGEWDESPVRTVQISQSFWMGSAEVTNEQYEQFDPSHKAYRGRRGFSKGDDEAVTFVSWHDAMRFCEWLGKKEGKHYRLPTEAEWEYACRAGTRTNYATGDTLPRVYFREQSSYEDHKTNHAKSVSLKIKQSPPNAWGLHDMHGNLEEWCHDWHGVYNRGATKDPVGPASGYARVTRGGSHNTDVYYLRSANRSAALPEDGQNFYIGFRVVQADLPAAEPWPDTPPPLVMSNVTQAKPGHVPADYTSDIPWFKNPRPYVRIPKTASGPLYWFHNHDPAITYCDNGDLLAIWFSTQREWGRELAIAGSRLRNGFDEWDPASLFFDVADRNDHAPAFWRDDSGRIYHFNGTGLGSWGGLATIMRTSDDNGATWSHPRFIKPEHASPAGCVESVIKTREGRLIVPVDSNKSTEILVSDDGGKTWGNPAKGLPADEYKKGGEGVRIAGIHASLVQLNDGSLLAFGRGADINEKIAMSRSWDQGQTWKYYESEFPKIRAGQRTVLKRLKEGPLMLVSFTDYVTKQDAFELGVQRGRDITGNGMIIIDAAGKKRRVYGMFAALSFDEGKTWPVKKLITPGGAPRQWFGHGWTKMFITADTAAEPLGYLAATQTPDGRIHLISSGLHYEFNLAWLKEPMPAEKK